MGDRDVHEVDLWFCSHPYESQLSAGPGRNYSGPVAAVPERLRTSTVFAEIVLAVDDDRFSFPFQILFAVWVTLSEHYWVILAEPRNLLNLTRAISSL